MLAQSCRRIARITPLIAASMLAAMNVHAQSKSPGGNSADTSVEAERPLGRPWWIDFEAGEGQIRLTSDEFTAVSSQASPTSTGSRRAAFELGFAGGRRLGKHARIGMDVDGWLLQAYNYNNPIVGESVTNVLGVIDVFPLRRIPLFLRAGAGAALYTNDRPLEFGGTGWAWTAGAGYEFPLPKRFGLAPIVDFDAGTRGDVHNVITVETGRRYSVVEFKGAITWHFGKPSRN